MGKKSTRENKSVYQLSREKAKLTREVAEDQVHISQSRLEKIEYGATPHPEEVLSMSRCYKDPSLCNYYCANECPIGQEYVPEIKIKDLSQITLEMLASINTLTKSKDRLVEITVDGKISADEMPDFNTIQATLDQMSIAIDSLKLWVSNKMEEIP